MTFRGVIKNRVVVRINGSARIGGPGRTRTTVRDRYRGVIGKAKGLPSDFAAQHDYYIHGTPKR